MANEIEGVSGPVSDTTRQALESLKAEGHTIDESLPAKFGDDEEVIENEKEEEAPQATPEKEPEPEAPKEQPKQEREHSYVPAWKLKVAEDQKAKAEARYQEAQGEIERLSRKPEMTNSDKENLGDALEALGDEFGVDKNFLAKLEKAIVSKTSIPKDISEKLKELDVIKQDRAKEYQENSYLKEFESDVLPIIKAENPNISETALSQIKDNLKKYAFSEEYAKLPLNKVFKVEKETLGIPVATPHKKTVESSRSGTTRATTTIDFDDMSEEQFKTLAPEQMLEFAKYKAGRR
jgi:hypothetical protein